MASKDREPPKSYDEIVRRTVPPFRPSREEEALARHRPGEATPRSPQQHTAAEHALLVRVTDALAANPALDLTEVEIDVDGDQVILAGTVYDPATAVRLEDLAAAVAGVDTVDNRLNVRGRRA